MGQDFCCIDIFIFQIADKRPDFNPLVMTVIYIIQACQVGNVSIVVIQINQVGESTLIPLVLARTEETALFADWFVT